MRVVRFYKSCPSSFSSSSSSSSLCPPRPPPLCPPFCHYLRQLDVVMGSARPQQGALDRSGQCQTSTGSSSAVGSAPDLNLNRELQIAVGSAGPHPGLLLPLLLLLRVLLLYAVLFAIIFASCMLQRAAPGLNRELQTAVGSAGPHPGNSRAEWAVPGLSCQKKKFKKYIK